MTAAECDAQIYALRERIAVLQEEKAGEETVLQTLRDFLSEMTDFRGGFQSKITEVFHIISGFSGAILRAGSYISKKLFGDLAETVGGADSQMVLSAINSDIQAAEEKIQEKVARIQELETGISEAYAQISMYENEKQAYLAEQARLQAEQAAGAGS